VRFIDRMMAMGRSKTTVRCYNGILGRLVRDLGDIQCRNITKQQVERWMYGLNAEHETQQWGKTTIPGVSPSTFNQNLYTLRSFFRWCQGEGYMRLNPVANMQAMKVPKKIRQRPSVHVLLRMLETPGDPRDRAYLAMALNTALRSSEIRPIRIADVDLADGYLDVTIRKTKDADEQPITEDLDQELRTWLVAYAENIGRALEPEDFLFPSIEAPRILTRDERGRIVQQPKKYRPEVMIGRTEHIIQQALEAVGLPTFGEGTHTIRRAVARAYYDAVSEEKGDVAALRETMAFLHHSAISTTERYLGLTAEKSRRDRRLRGKPFLTALVGQPNVVPIRPVDRIVL
jgi:integrase